jgi:hypothetical protein
MGITLAYDLRLGRMIARWKGINEEINFGDQEGYFLNFEVYYYEKPHLGPQNGPESLATEKMLKIVNC